MARPPLHNVYISSIDTTNSLHSITIEIHENRKEKGRREGEGGEGGDGGEGEGTGRKEIQRNSHNLAQPCSHL